jgi:hypothetical protein
MAKLMGWSRTHAYRVHLMGQLPDDLFEALVTSRPVPSTREFAAVALTLQGRHRFETQHCPNCGHLLRVRAGFSVRTARTVDRWLASHRSGTP